MLWKKMYKILKCKKMYSFFLTFAINTSFIKFTQFLIPKQIVDIQYTVVCSKLVSHSEHNQRPEIQLKKLRTPQWGQYRETFISFKDMLDEKIYSKGHNKSLHLAQRVKYESVLFHMWYVTGQKRKGIIATARCAKWHLLRSLERSITAARHRTISSSRGVSKVLVAFVNQTSSHYRAQFLIKQLHVFWLQCSICPEISDKMSTNWCQNLHLQKSLK